MLELAQSFHVLFTGLNVAHGEYTIPSAGTQAGAKIQGQAYTREGPATVALWEKHLTAPGFGLGITLARQDGTCRFGAIDVDRYSLDLPKLNKLIQDMELPLVLCRTKSGGAHLYLFGAEDLPCILVRAKLKEWADALGEGKQPLPNGQSRDVEIFPKQDRIQSQDDCGSWINCPYQGGANSTRYALGPDSRSLTAEHFIAYAQQCAVTVKALRQIEPATPAEAEDDGRYYGAPPCLQTLAVQGYAEGTRNNGLFNIGVFLKKAYPEDWEQRILEYNKNDMSPPLVTLDTVQVIKSLRKKEYSYRCKDQPICGVCDRKVCLTREFGISKGSDNIGVNFDRLEKIPTDPPTWIGVIDGIRIKMETGDIMDYRRFQGRCVDEMNKWPPSLKPGMWNRMVIDLLQNVTVLPAPPDATSDGQLTVYLQRFCTSRTQAKNKDEILMGKPYTDAEQGRTIFCVTDFLQYLQQHRVAGANEKRLYVWLSERGDITSHQEVIKGKMIQYWSIIAFSAQTEEFDTPRMEQGAPF